MILNSDPTPEVIIWLIIIGVPTLVVGTLVLVLIRLRFVLRKVGMVADDITHALRCDGPTTGHCPNPQCRYNRHKEQNP